MDFFPPHTQLYPPILPAPGVDGHITDHGEMMDTHDAVQPDVEHVAPWEPYADNDVDEGPFMMEGVTAAHEAMMPAAVTVLDSRRVEALSRAVEHMQELYEDDSEHSIDVHDIIIMANFLLGVQFRMERDALGNVVTYGTVTQK
jgi:hypothetical protein